MHCTKFDFSGDDVGECGNEDFDVTLPLFLTVDLSGESDQHTTDLDGICIENATVTCKKCGKEVDDIEIRKAVTVALLKLENKLNVRMPQFSAFGFEDGTEIIPAEVEVHTPQEQEAP